MNKSQLLANKDQTEIVHHNIFIHTYVCMLDFFVCISWENVIFSLKTMLLFKTSEGV